MKKFIGIFGEIARETCCAKLALGNNPGTLPNPLSRSFRTIGALVTISLRPPEQFTVLHPCLHTLRSEHKSQVPRVYVTSIIRLEKPEDSHFRRSPRYSPRTFLRKQCRAHVITSSQLISSRRHTVRTFFLGLTPATLIRAASSTDTGHALAIRMTNARPPWQRGRRKPDEGQKEKERAARALGLKRERDGRQPQREWEQGREKEKNVERERERQREIRRIRGKTEGKKANVLVQRPCRLVRAPPPLTLEFIATLHQHQVGRSGRT